MKKCFLTISLLLVVGVHLLSANNDNNNSSGNYGETCFVYGDSLYQIVKCDCGMVKSYHPKGASAIEILKMQNKDHNKGCANREIIGYSMETKKKGEVSIGELRNINGFWYYKILSGKINMYARVTPVLKKSPTDVNENDAYIQKGDLAEPLLVVKLKERSGNYALFDDNEAAKIFLDSILGKKGKIVLQDFYEAIKIYNGEN